MKSVVRSGMNSRWACVPFIQPLPSDAARADRDRRLDDVEALAERVGGRVDQRHHALALVVVHHRPGDRQAGRRRRRPAPTITFHDRPARKMT